MKTYECADVTPSASELLVVPFLVVSKEVRGEEVLKEDDISIVLRFGMGPARVGVKIRFRFDLLVSTKKNTGMIDDLPP